MSTKVIAVKQASVSSYLPTKGDPRGCAEDTGDGEGGGVGGGG